MQSIGAVFGATLTNVSNHCCVGVDYVHSITIDEQSKLYKIIDTNHIMVNSRHNEMIVNPLDVKVVGYSDQVIEAIEKEEALFLLGVQWHPEDMVKYDESSSKIFNALFQACYQYHTNK
jgi:putative glutamine amidotransferase